MAKKSHESQHDRQLKKINAYARKKAKDMGKKEYEESEKNMIQTRL